jgi:hypothetical protein
MSANSKAAAEALVSRLRQDGSRADLLLLYGHGKVGKTETALSVALALALENDLSVFYCVRRFRPEEKAHVRAIHVMAAQYDLDAPGVFTRRQKEQTIQEWTGRVREQAQVERTYEGIDPAARQRLNNLLIVDGFGITLDEMETALREEASKLRDEHRPPFALVVMDELYGFQETRRILRLHAEFACAFLLVENTEAWRGDGEIAIERLLAHADGSYKLTERSFTFRRREQRMDAWMEFAARYDRVLAFIAEDARRERLR